MPGSSPLARGPLTGYRESWAGKGLIPARAGTTSRAPHGHAASWAHPRSRGDHPTSRSNSTSRPGSSPLARGPHAHFCQPIIKTGLIPARAGTTRVLSPRRLRVRAHPRSRGDHTSLCSASLSVLGSSPLARGPLHKLHAGDSLAGLIPARAGTTHWLVLRSRGRRAHPRSRGDHRRCSTPPAIWLGSSPLARGPHIRAGLLLRKHGLIPARAGTTAHQ